MDFCVDPELCRQCIEATNEPEQLLSKLNGRLVMADEDGCAVGEMIVGPENLNPWGTVHGGALATFADTVAGLTAVVCTGQACVTFDSHLNFIRAADEGTIVCRSRPEHIGRTFCVIHVTIEDQEGNLLVSGDINYCPVGPIPGLA